MEMVFGVLSENAVFAGWVIVSRVHLPILFLARAICKYSSVVGITAAATLRQVHGTTHCLKILELALLSWDYFYFSFLMYISIVHILFHFTQS